MSFQEQLRGLFDASDVDGSGFLDERERLSLVSRPPLDLPCFVHVKTGWPGSAWSLKCVKWGKTGW
jgi:hypothetical protein